MLLKSLYNRLKYSVKQNARFKFVTTFTTHKVAFYTNMKDQKLFICRSYIVYHFECLGCSFTYAGKTERTLHEHCK